MQNSLVARCRSSSLLKITRYYLKICSLLVITKYSLQNSLIAKITRYSLQNSLVARYKEILVTLFESKVPPHVQQSEITKPRDKYTFKRDQIHAAASLLVYQFYF